MGSDMPSSKMPNELSEIALQNIGAISSSEGKGIETLYETNIF
jgi:hypothetical protein